MPAWRRSVLLVFTGVVQFIAGLSALRRENTLVGAAFCTFGGFNSATAMLVLLQAVHVLPMDGYPAARQGFLFECFAFIALELTIAAIGGWFLVASSFFAYWLGSALRVNSLWERPLLPLWGKP